MIRGKAGSLINYVIKYPALFTSGKWPFRELILQDKIL